jgi:FdhD protein
MMMSPPGSSVQCNRGAVATHVAVSPDITRARRRSPARMLPEEAAVALVYDGTTQAVLMATPADLSDFAVGFALTEGIARGCAVPEIVRHRNGFELRVWLGAHDAATLAARRRAALGPVGCGLCGIDSLAQALRPAPKVSDGVLTLRSGDFAIAEQCFETEQPLRQRTGATHAAGFFIPGRGMIAVREDVGRHNALDKLAGALWRAGVDPGQGAVVMTSRVSVDLVQKTAAIGAPALLAVSAPTGLAVAAAEQAGLTLVTGIGRADPAVHTHPHRIEGAAP